MFRFQFFLSILLQGTGTHNLFDVCVCVCVAVAYVCSAINICFEHLNSYLF